MKSLLLKVEDRLDDKLVLLAAAKGCSKTELIRKAIQEYVKFEEHNISKYLHEKLQTIGD